MTIWGHSRNEAGKRQTLRDHLLGTAHMAREFAEPMGVPEAGWTVGLLHDVGKVSREWQHRLLCLEAGVDAAAVNHKDLGAEYCLSGGFLHGCLVVAGHHGGIPDIGQRPQGLIDPHLWAAVRQAVPEVEELPELRGLLPPEWTADVALGEFGIRMLHSCLVDADYLDTAAHFANSTPQRAEPADMAALLERVLVSRREFLAVRAASPVDQQRNLVFDACVTKAEDSPGVFRLSAPTGAGKTIAAAAFALRHCSIHNKRRVVVAVPFTSVTEQNAAVYRSLLGDGVVLEHHSAVEPEQLAGRGVENWDAPFVVTTTVQLFESLFSNKPSKTRKLHRLVNSVIVLDEVQAIPDRLLVPILDALRILVDHFGVTVLMASATQPTWEALKPWRERGLDPREIVTDRRDLFRTLRRVRYEWRTLASIEELAREALSGQASLTVVNTTANSRLVAREYADRVGPEGVRHLSTRMCRAHRTEVLAEVKRRLESGSPVHLVSTQLIEAGVDVDFPVVLRQEAPAPSLIQAGGRANREGHLSSGRVFVFDCPELATIRDYATPLSLTRVCFADNPDGLDDPEIVADYYRRLYSAAATEEQARGVQLGRQQLAFAQVAALFRMIEDDTTSVVVDWQGLVHTQLLADLSERMRHGLDVVPMRLLRDVQPFTVALPSRLAATPEISARIHEPARGLRLWRGPYDSTTGIGETEPMSYVF
ncbi:MAG TPA: CRISPR-associated helicase Cas3' [Candidatus Luteococcus avicola]|nr:CRISPR-associated helicase Cas3' [Candidatus Luteococcus avicola]